MLKTGALTLWAFPKDFVGFSNCMSVRRREAAEIAVWTIVSALWDFSAMTAATYCHGCMK